MVWFLSFILPPLSHILSSINGTDFTFYCHAILCLWAFAYGAPLVCNIFLLLIDFCQHISNHSTPWKISPHSRRLSSCVSCPKSLVGCLSLTPGDPCASTKLPPFLYHHTDCVSLAPDTQVHAAEGCWVVTKLPSVAWTSYLTFSNLNLYPYKQVC